MSLPSKTEEQLEEFAALRTRLEPQIRALSAGPWTAQLIGDELAHLSFADRPVLRAIKAVVRDQDWRTPKPSVQDVEIKQDKDRLKVRWNIAFAGYGVAYDGVMTAEFTPATAQFSFEGNAGNAFRSNRIGLVVLHPAADAGRAVTVEHPDGGTTAAQFPHGISPHQPFMDIAALEWADAGTAFRLSFTGDIFETEDQRNWTDASFKTYSTPLSQPYPVDVPAGGIVRQSALLEAATLESEGGVEKTPRLGIWQRPACRPMLARFGGPTSHVPALAVGACSDPGILPVIPGLDALVVELVEVPGASARSGWARQLQAASVAPAMHRAGMDIRAVTADPVAAIADLARYLPQAKRLAIFHPASHVSEPDTWQELKTSVRKAGFRGSLLAGTRAHFTELNREAGRIPSDADALTFSITPQMHSNETAHIIDSLPIQRLVAQNALRLGGGRPLHVGPVTLLPRFNAVATSNVDAEAEADELQADPFTAAWTLASISALTLEGVASVSYFEASGPRGICDVDGRPTPAGALLMELAALRNSAVLSVDLQVGQSDSGAVTLYPVQSSEGLVLFAGNLSGSTIAVDVQLPNGVSEVEGAGASFGQDSSAVDFSSYDRCDAASGRLTLGPWTAGVVRFPAAT